MESALFILLLRRLFLFKPKVVIWEVPWSPGWRFREIVASIALPRADLSIVFSTSQASLVKHRFGSSVPVKVITFCIDTRFFDPECPAISQKDLPERFVLSVGRDAGRDFQVVVDAMAGGGTNLVLRAPASLVAQAGPNVYHLKDRLDWSRYRNLYSQATIVVVAARETPNASGVTSLLEAMAMAKPVIVTRTAALSDYLPPPGAGIIVPVGDAEAIRKAVDELMADEQKRRSMGAKARAFVLARFSPERHFAAMAEMIHQISGNGLPQSRVANTSPDPEDKRIDAS